MFRIRCLLLAVLLFCANLGYPQRTPPPVRATAPEVNTHYIPDQAKLPTAAALDVPVKFTSKAELVMVPVVVRDKNNKHITGLEKADFTVLENGKEQKVTIFEEVKAAGEAQLQKVPTAAGEYTNQLAGTSNAAPQFVIIVLDMVNTPVLNQDQGRRQLIKYLADNIKPNMMVSLLTINSKGVTVLHDFTSNTAELVAALQQVKGRLHLMEGLEANSSLQPAATTSINSLTPDSDLVAALNDFATAADSQIANFRQARAIELTMEALENIGQAYAGIPGRKALIWATGSFPFTIDTDSGLPNGAPVDLYERTMKVLNQGNFAIYPVDVRGLEVTVGAGHMATLTTMETFADMTGGKAFYNRNDIAASYKEATEDDSSYYLLGYYLDKANTKPGWRNLKVKTKAEDARVRARKGFFVSNFTIDPRYSRGNDIEMGLRSPLDYTSLPFLVQLTGIEKKGNKSQIKFTVALAPNAAYVDEDDKNHILIDVIAASVDSKGERSPQVFSSKVETRIKPEQMAQVREMNITTDGAIDVANDAYALRFVVRDGLTGKMGSLKIPLKK